MRQEAAGVVAHQSALKDGELMKIPRCTLGKSTFAYSHMIGPRYSVGIGR
jgi:hypothetical protein